LQRPPLLPRYTSHACTTMHIRAIVNGSRNTYVHFSSIPPIGVVILSLVLVIIN
jgi:hypothetical protein